LTIIAGTVKTELAGNEIGASAWRDDEPSLLLYKSTRLKPADAVWPTMSLTPLE
jgi:hypothetical protein